MNTFGENMRRIRNERGLSMESLAEMLGTTKQVLSRYETGKRVPKVSMAVKIANALNVTASQLTGMSEAMLEHEAIHDEIWEKREELRRTPGRRMLFDLAENATEEDIEAVVKLVEALKATNPSFYDGDDPA